MENAVGGAGVTRDDLDAIGGKGNFENLCRCGS